MALTHKNRHNPNNIHIGDKCILDKGFNKGFNNESIVIVQGITPLEMYCSVISEEDEHSTDYSKVIAWEVMSYRLSPLNQLKL